jgi:hypothetical protein
MKLKLAALLLMLSGCSSSSNQFQVTDFKMVYGAEAAPWRSACLVTVENRTQRFTGLHGLPCEHLEIGDKAAFNKDHSIFSVNDVPYSVRSVQTR